MTTVDRAVADALIADAASREAEPETLVVQVQPDTRLEQLLCEYETMKEAHDRAETEWDEYRSAMIAELEALAPTRHIAAFEIPKGPMWPALTIAWREGREYLPSALIRQHIPQIWDGFKKRSKGFWDIRRKSKRG